MLPFNTNLFSVSAALVYTYNNTHLRNEKWKTVDENKKQKQKKRVKKTSSIVFITTQRRGGDEEWSSTRVMDAKIGNFFVEICFLPSVFLFSVPKVRIGFCEEEKWRW